MATVRIIITLKPGILDAAGQAVRQGLQALGYDQTGEVRIGRYVEITMPEGFASQDVHQMCERFLANPLIEQWRFETGAAAAGPAQGRSLRSPRPEGPRPSGRKSDLRGLH